MSVFRGRVFARMEIGKLHFHVAHIKGTHIFQVGWNGDHRYTHKFRIEVK